MVRVRFAPSPTGLPHIGNLRTALFNWLFARHHGGVFVLRIEDTDVARKVEGAEEAILSSLRWMGLDWDEGPYFQSGRLPLYQKTARALVESGHAYHCFCSTERLDEMRREQMRRKMPPGYDRLCRNLTPAQREELLALGITPVIRFRIPLEGQVRFNDLVKGQVTFNHSTLDDFVLLKADGFPTYHLANIVDDHDMRISHVLRADEWLASTPRHLLLYQALGYEPPQFVHLPMILSDDRSKLSKRHGAVSVTEFQVQGFLPQAMVNFMALLGWSLDDHTEILTQEELVRHFSVERLARTGAIFNREKLEWMNGVYLRKLTLEDFIGMAQSYLERDLPPSVPRPLNRGYLLQMAPFIQERARTLGEVSGLADFFFLVDVNYEVGLLLKGIEKDAHKQGRDVAEATPMAVEALDKAMEALEQAAVFEPEPLEQAFRVLGEELGLSPGGFFGLLRVALTGRTASPPLFNTISILSRERSLTRLAVARGKLEPTRL
ncbi:MAG: glutamate--tRNA ligase [Dehalococcoidia bacterium]|nr:glutamate--tRNA ligase [Dehalococcoidia bacterium]